MVNEAKGLIDADDLLQGKSSEKRCRYARRTVVYSVTDSSIGKVGRYIGKRRKDAQSRGFKKEGASGPHSKHQLGSLQAAGFVPATR